MSAIASASSSALGASRTATPATACAISRSVGRHVKRCQRSVVLGRAHRLAHQAPRAARSAARRRGPGSGQHVLAPHAQRIEQLLEAELRVLGVLPARSRSSSPRRAPGRAPAAPARRWAGRPRPAAAPSRPGTLLMTPATMTGASGGASLQPLAPAPAPARLSRCIFETRPCSARCAGQCSVTILRKRQRPSPSAAANVSGTSAVHPRVVDVLDLHRVHQPGELARQPGRLRRRAGGRRHVGADVGLGPAPPRSASDHRSTSLASASCRSISPMAGGISPAPPRRSRARRRTGSAPRPSR